MRLSRGGFCCRTIEQDHRSGSNRSLQHSNRSLDPRTVWGLGFWTRPKLKPTPKSQFGNPLAGCLPHTPHETVQLKAFVGSMAITVTVALLSARTATVKVGLDEDVGTLKHRAQTALGVGRGRLLNSSRSVLDVSACQTAGW